jgi:coronin-1B/1C/6
MANRFVRSSKYRHVFGTANKNEQCYNNIKITKTPHESNMSDVNSKFLAVVVEAQGGGTFLVVPLSKVFSFSSDMILLEAVWVGNL